MIRQISLTLGLSFLMFAFQNCSNEVPGGATSSNSQSVPKDILFDSIPGDQNLFPGDSANVNVLVSSKSGLSMTYRWQKNGVEISGLIDASLQIPSLAESDVGTYTFTASNSIESRSVSFKINLRTPSTISFSQQPQPIKVVLGQIGSLVALASSSDNQSLSYQWFKDAVAIPGANTPILNLGSVVEATAGQYYVEVYRTVGPKTGVKSATVKVSVQQTFNVQGPTGCVNGYCACRGAAINTPDAGNALSICQFKGYPTLDAFTTAPGIVGGLHCSADGASCQTNLNPGNLICATLTCSR